MDQAHSFSPPRLPGLAFHAVGLLLILIAVGIMVSLASEDLSSLDSVLLLVASILLSAFFPVLAYRLFALLQSEYRVGREGLFIRWGLRQIQLPHDRIVDSALAAEIEEVPTLPRWRWPGAFVGRIQNEELGEVEYLASQSSGLVLIGTLDRVYILSPENPAEFLARLRSDSERGSLQPGRFFSVEPSSVFSQAWAEPGLRWLLIAGAALALLLFVLVGLLIQDRQTLALGFDPLLRTRESVAAAQLYLLPALNLTIFMGNLLLGLILFRERQGAIFARLLWAGSLVSALLFAAALLFIVGAS